MIMYVIFLANCSACHAGGRNVIVPEKTLQSDVLNANGMKSVDAITYTRQEDQEL